MKKLKIMGLVLATVLCSLFTACSDLEVEDELPIRNTIRTIETSGGTDAGSKSWYFYPQWGKWEVTINGISPEEYSGANAWWAGDIATLSTKGRTIADGETLTIRAKCLEADVIVYALIADNGTAGEDYYAMCSNHQDKMWGKAIDAGATTVEKYNTAAEVTVDQTLKIEIKRTGNDFSIELTNDSM